MSVSAIIIVYEIHAILMFWLERAVGATRTGLSATRAQLVLAVICGWRRAWTILLTFITLACQPPYMSFLHLEWLFHAARAFHFTTGK